MASVVAKTGTSEVRNVLITGASRGLGLGIARKLSVLGYRAIAVARSKSSPNPGMPLGKIGKIDRRVSKVNKTSLNSFLTRRIPRGWSDFLPLSRYEEHFHKCG